MMATMFAEERRKLILDDLTRTGRVEVATLAQHYAVSEDTIRRDLRELAEQGFLQKTHGGAVALDTAHMPWRVRTQLLPEAKTRIGQAAAALVEPHQTVILDAGLTTLELARHLTARPLTIVTNSFDIAALFVDDAEVELVLTGGVWNREDRHFSGPLAEAAIRRYRADWTFLGVCAVHPKAGITATYAPDAEVKRSMLECGVKVVLLADHCKFGQVVSHHVAPLQAIDLLLTDEPTSLLDGLDITVTVVDKAAVPAV